MILLLDTCALLWFLSDDSQLSATAKAAIEEPANVRWLSPIKASLRAHGPCFSRVLPSLHESVPPVSETTAKRRNFSAAKDTHRNAEGRTDTHLNAIKLSRMVGGW
jgi:hypothetical protein